MQLTATTNGNSGARKAAEVAPGRLTRRSALHLAKVALRLSMLYSESAGSRKEVKEFGGVKRGLLGGGMLSV